MPLSFLIAAGACLAVLLWLLRALAHAFLCLLLVVYPTPSLLTVLVIALGLLFIR